MNWFVSAGQPIDLAIVLEGIDPNALTLDILGSCPGPAAISITNATPNSPVYVGYSTTLGSWALPGSPCAGTIIGIDSPTLLPGPTLIADGLGAASKNVNLPPAACGSVHVLAFDLASCNATNIVSL